MAKGNNQRCSFCNKSQKEVGPFVEGTGSNPPVYICIECAGNSKDILDSERRKQQMKSGRMPLPTPRQVYDHLNRFVVGQDSAKRLMAVSVVNHYKRLRAADDKARGDGPDDRVRLDKANMLVVGPTGTGKTLMAKGLAEMLGVPFAIGDATTLTEAGYVGEDVENLILKLLRAADFDIELTERGIIYIDEIDKIHKTGGNVSITRDVSGEGVQQSLLKMIEGTTSSVPPQGGRKHPEQQYIQIDTTNILFICGGAFTGLEDIISRRIGRGGMGFHAQGKAKPDEEKSALLRQVEQDDLIEFGLIPEFVGRLPVIATLDELDEEQLRVILTGSNGLLENALVEQYKKMAAFDNVTLTFTDDAVREIAKLAKEKGTGARALRAVMESFMADILFDLPDHPNTTLVIDQDVVRKRRAVFPRHEAEAA